MKNCIKSIIALVLAMSFVFVSGGVATAEEPKEINYQTMSEEQLTSEIEKALEVVYTQIVHQNSVGQWRVVPSYQGEIGGISVDQADQMVASLNLMETAYQQSNNSAGEGTIKPAGAVEYVKCVLTGLIPGAGLVSIDFEQVYIWLRQRAWNKLSPYLAKHAVKVGIKDMAKFTPWGLAAALAVNLVKCAIFG